MNKPNQEGVAHVALVIVILLVLALVGFAFLRIQQQASEETAPESTTSVEESDNTIENADDLREAEEALNATNLDAELDTSDIDEAIQ